MVALTNTEEINQITLTTGLLLMLLAGIVLAMMNRETKIVRNQSIGGCPCFKKTEKITNQTVNADFYAPYASQRNTIVKMKPISSESVILIDNY